MARASGADLDDQHGGVVLAAPGVRRIHECFAGGPGIADMCAEPRGDLLVVEHGVEPVGAQQDDVSALQRFLEQIDLDPAQIAAGARSVDVGAAAARCGDGCG